MGIDKRFAIFAKCDQDKNPYKHTTGPFLYINQFKYCTQIIRIPLDFFIQLGNQVGGPPNNLKMVLLSNVGRCGSTLLTQLFEQMPKTVAISEPEVFMEFTHSRTFDHVPKERYQELLKCCVNLLYVSAIQSKPNEMIDCILFKPKAHGVLIAGDFAQMYLKTKHLFMFRHPEEYVQSMKSVFKSLMHPIMRHLVLMMAMKMQMEEFIMRQLPKPTEEQIKVWNKKDIRI